MKTERTLYGGLFICCLGMLVIALSGVNTKALKVPATKQQAEALQPMGQVGRFELVDEHNSPFTSDMLKGKVWIAGFFFTRCAGICLETNTAIANLCRELSGTNIQFVCITMDPAFDVPKVLAQYRKARDFNGEKWAFLTGNPDEISRLSKDDFKLAAANSAEGEIVHSSKLVLVDREMRIRGYYDGLDKNRVGVLGDDARRLELTLAVPSCCMKAKSSRAGALSSSTEKSAEGAEPKPVEDNK